MKAPCNCVRSEGENTPLLIESAFPGYLFVVVNKNFEQNDGY